MNDHFQYVAVLKGKKGEFGALRRLNGHARFSPLIEPIPSKAAEETAEEMDEAWGKSDQYFVDLGFSDDPRDNSKPTPSYPLRACVSAARAMGQRVIPVTGLNRSPAYQHALLSTADSHEGFALRLSLQDFEDEDRLARAIDQLLSLAQTAPRDVDLMIDLGSIVGIAQALVARMMRSSIETLPLASEWRTLTIISGSFPDGLAGVQRGWSTITRTEWLAWRSLITSKKAPSRIPAYGDYTIAHPDLPHEGRATILAQIRYCTDEGFLIYKGLPVLKSGYDQFNSVCRQLLRRSEYSGPDFSPGDREIQEKAATGSQPGNPSTWRRIGVSHHVEMVRSQIASLAET